jgi:hypothetical protein
MIHRKEQGKTKADKGESHKDRGVKIGLGYPADNAQGQEKDVHGTDAVQDGKEKQDLGYVGLLFPEL